MLEKRGLCTVNVVVPTILHIRATAAFRISIQDGRKCDQYHRTGYQGETFSSIILHFHVPHSSASY